MALWDMIRDTIREGISLAADKGEELTRIGRIRLEIACLKRSITRNHTILGERVQGMIASGNTDIATDSEVQRLIENINRITIELGAQELHLADVKGRPSPHRDTDPPAPF